MAAKAVKGTAGEVVTLTGYAAGVAAFGEDAADTPGMATHPAAAVCQRRLHCGWRSAVAEAGAVKDYQDGLCGPGRGGGARILVCDSADETVQQALRDSGGGGLLPPAGSASPWWAATVSRQRSW